MAGGQDPKWQKDAADQNFDYMFKLLIIGNSSVGKTSFLFRYADDSFTSAFVSTVGIDFKVKTVFRHDKRVKLQIWVRSKYVRLCIGKLMQSCGRQVTVSLFLIYMATIM
jgi:Ras-related protein Rab-3C